MITPGHDEYSFNVDAFTPATLPMARLADYLSGLSKLLAYQEYVHFRRIKSGSAILVAEVDTVAVPKVYDRLREGNAPDRGALRDVYITIDEMLAKDNAIGRLCRRPAGGRKSAQILYFPGRERQADRLGPFNETIAVVGVVMRIGGRDETAHIQIEDSDGRPIKGSLTRDLARQIAPHLYQPLRFEGDARWVRGASEEWELLSFRVKSFSEVAGDSLVDVLARMRAVPGNAWRELDDPIGQLRVQRGSESDT